MSGARQVSVQVVPGCPHYLEDIEFDDDILILLKLAKVRHLIQEGALSWSEYSEVDRMLDEQESIPLSSLDPSLFDMHQQRFQELLKVLDARDPLQKILHLKDDILGEYAFRTNFYNEEEGEVFLYWGIIGLVSDVLGVNAEDLTVVVLAHELAHAYTHQGFEIDGTQWDSSRLRCADPSVTEGLAQYFTHLFLTSKQDAFPHALEAFDKLRAKQAECYSAHEVWVTDYTPEHVRRAMLEARRSRDRVTKEKFERMMVAAKEALSFD